MMKYGQPGVHVVKSKELEKFEFGRGGKGWIYRGTKVTKNNVEQIRRNSLLNPLDYVILYI